MSARRKPKPPRPAATAIAATAPARGRVLDLASRAVPAMKTAAAAIVSACGDVSRTDRLPGRWREKGGFHVKPPFFVPLFKRQVHRHPLEICQVAQEIDDCRPLSSARPTMIRSIGKLRSLLWRMCTRGRFATEQQGSVVPPLASLLFPAARAGSSTSCGSMSASITRLVPGRCAELGAGGGFPVGQGGGAPLAKRSKTSPCGGGTAFCDGQQWLRTCRIGRAHCSQRGGCYYTCCQHNHRFFAASCRTLVRVLTRWECTMGVNRRAVRLVAG